MMEKEENIQIAMHLSSRDESEWCLGCEAEEQDVYTAFSTLLNIYKQHPVTLFFPYLSTTGNPSSAALILHRSRFSNFSPLFP